MAGIIGADNRFGRDFGNPSVDMQGNITTLYDIGCVVESILSYFMGARLGRRQLLMTGAAIMIISTVLLAASYNTAALLAGHIITGISNSMNSSAAPAFSGSDRAPGEAALALSAGPPRQGREVISVIMDRPADDEAVARVLLDIQSGLEEEQKDGPFRFREMFS
ncbi:uncharacterized protein DNG_07381 [Cephalotrichum gorgonifer]|uniref:Major facilitator superfamily (MFS) profile domain-containing protein n=1 Tax=Cephalotrichum gorgonifer TaxID=2041049 RepID=A0AAE8SXC5_9PEZI|nr:uncharacterized protein DNG_07381 [Cephalotrichum gorgonifer]